MPRVTRINQNKSSNCPALIAYPTEGVFGLGCAFDDLAGFTLLTEIKKPRLSQVCQLPPYHSGNVHSGNAHSSNAESARQSTPIKSIRKSFIVLMTKQHDLSQFTSIVADQIDARMQTMGNTRPITWLLPANCQCPRQLIFDGKVAIRLAQEPPLTELLDCLGTAVLSSSLNLSGQRPARTNVQARQVVSTITLKYGVDIELFLTTQPLAFTKPSRIIDWHTQQRLR